MSSLDGKVAVVTGASRGIGRGIAVELGAAGAFVYVTGRTLERRPGALSSLQDTVQEIEREGGRAIALQCDHLVDQQTLAVFERIRSEQDHLDILVNSVFNAPMMGATIGVPFWKQSLDVWRDTVDLPTRSAYVASVLAAPLLVGGAPDSLIVNVSAPGAERYRYNVAFGVGKAGLDKMTHDMAEDLRDHGVAVVSIWPNVTTTEHVLRSAELLAKQYGSIDRIETPRYSGRAVVALASDPELMARSGGRFWVADLGADYGFTDVKGQVHQAPEL